MDHCPFCKSKNIKFMTSKESNEQFIKILREDIKDNPLVTVMLNQMEKNKDKYQELEGILNSQTKIAYCESCGEEFDLNGDYHLLEAKTPHLISFSEYESILREQLDNDTLIDIYLAKAKRCPNHYIEQIEELLKTHDQALKMINKKNENLDNRYIN